MRENQKEHQMKVKAFLDIFVVASVENRNVQ